MMSNLQNWLLSSEKQIIVLGVVLFPGSKSLVILLALMLAC